MWPSTLPRSLHRGVCVLATVGLLAGCAPGSMTTQSQRIGSDDGTDSCRRELVALDSTGNFFAEDILKGAAVGAIGGAILGGLAGGGRGALIGAAAGGALGAAGGYYSALQSQARDQAGMLSQAQRDLQAEGVQIDKTQIAFNNLVACRFGQARAIRNAMGTGQMPRDYARAQMAIVRDRAKRDLALARLINDKIGERGQQFDLAADKLSTGGRTVSSSYRRPVTRTVVVRRPVPIKVVPNANAPEVAQVNTREQLTVQGTQGDYALVQTSSGTRGYAPLSSLNLPRERTGGGGDVTSLAGSNARSRDNFAQSVSVLESASASSFEVAG